MKSGVTYRLCKTPWHGSNRHGLFNKAHSLRLPRLIYLDSVLLIISEWKCYGSIWVIMEKKIIAVTAFCNLVILYTDLNPYLFASRIKCFVYMTVCV